MKWLFLANIKKYIDISFIIIDLLLYINNNDIYY